MSDLWVFGYGSLIWKPGFPFVVQRRAALVGFHRALCIFSVRYRGSSERPGLVFGLDAGGYCEGVAFRVAAKDAGATTAYLRDREQVTGAYQAGRRLVELAHDGGQVRALCFIANRSHQQYAGRLPVATQVRVLRASKGTSGPNADYVLNTAAHLADLGIHDPLVAHIAGRLGRCSGVNLPYPIGHTPRLPPDRALRCGYQRNLTL